MADPNISHGAGRSTKVSDVIARDILQRIREDGLAPGTKLAPEAEMLKVYGVGRASLREALRILETYGLIRIKPGPGGGPIVADVDSDDFGRTSTFFYQAVGATVGELVEARIVLEPLIARAAAQNIDPDGAAALRATLKEESADADGASWGAATAGVHAVIAGMTGNKVLDLLGCSLISVLAHRTRSVFPVDERDAVRRIHGRIGDAIIEGDADLAETLTRAHVEAISDRMKADLPHVLDEPVDWR